MIPDDEVERVRESADIVAIIGEYVNLRRVGADFRGPCPFHQGTHRNFSVSPRRNVYNCFVCGEKGDVFTFLRKRLGVDWPSAVRMVAQKTGLDLHETQAKRDGPDPREPLWEVNAAAQVYFERVLWDDPLGHAARTYLAERAIPRDLASQFGMGFAPREIGLMRAALGTLGFDDERLLTAGLLVRAEDSAEPRPRFRERLVFPIHDISGRVAGFGGRLLRSGEPKYLNTAESPVYSKGRLLYGLHTAKNAIRRTERALLVEGYFDVVRLVGNGIEEVVAPLGTALTSDQAALLAKYTRNVFLLYDSDKAGLKATFRSGDELLTQGASVRVVTLPDGEDPDTFVQKFGRDALEEQLDQAIDVFERKVQLLQRGGWFSDLHRRRQAIDRLLPTIRAAIDPLTRDMYIGRAAEASGIDRQVLAEEAGEPAGQRPRSNRWSSAPAPTAARALSAAAEAQRTPRRVPRAAPAPRGAGSSAERELVRAMIQSRGLVERVAERVGPDQFRDARYREIFDTLLRVGPETLADELTAAMSRDATETFDRLSGDPEVIQDLERTVHDCLTRIQTRDLEERRDEIQRLLLAAQDVEKDKLVREKEQIRDEIRRLAESGSSL